MPKVKHVQDIRTTVDAERWALSHGAEVINGGRHKCISNKYGRCPLPHEKELCKGTRHAIIKRLIAMGLACVGIAIGLEQMGVVLW